MNSIDMDIQMALNVPMSSIFCEYGPVFSNACENLEEIEKILNYTNKNILLPTSSGDQYLFAVYKGASNITTFDINKLTKYYMNLKIAAIKTFTCLNDFLPFLITDKTNLFDTKRNLIYKIFDNLDKDDLYFWSNYLKKANNINLQKLVTNIYNRFDINYIQNGLPFYKNDNDYKQLRNKLLISSNPTFINSDLFTITLNNKYDIMDFSNIISTDISYTNFYDIYGSSKEEWLDKLKSDILKFLCHDGKIIIDYIYNVKNRSITPIFEQNNILRYDIPSKTQEERDAVFIYKNSLH